MGRTRILLASAALCVGLAGCGEAASAVPPAPTVSRALVLTNPSLAGEYQSPTPVPPSVSGPSPTSQPTKRPTVGAISYQTPTAVPTGGTDIRDVANDARFNPTQPAGNSGSPAVPQAGISVGQGPPAYPTPTAAPPPPTATPTPVLLATGQSLPIDLPAGSSGCDTSQTFKFYYPGDNSTVTIDAQLDGLTPANGGNAGLHVWDSTSSTAPVNTATTQTNQKNSVPGSIELSYGRLIAGQVTIELYNWTQTPLTGTISVVNLASNNAPLQMVSDKSPGAC